MKKFFAISAFVLLCVALAVQAAAAQCPGNSLTVEITGNTKTKRSTILRLAKLRGECVPEKGIDPAYIKQELLNSHLFSTVEVEVEEGEGVTTVHITVKDKWTIIPVPVLFTSDRQTGGGLMVVDTNLLGRKKMAMMGVAFSNLGNRYEGIYIDDAVMGSNWVLILRPLFMKREVYQYDDDDEVYGYEEEFNMVFAILGYKITDHFAPAMGLIYRYRSLDAAEDYPAPRNEKSTNGAMVNVRFGYGKYTDYYDKGWMFTFVFEQYLKELGADTVYSHMQGVFESAYPIWKILWRTQIEGGWSFGPDVVPSTYWRMGGRVGSRGYSDNGLWLSNYVSLSQELEQVVLRIKYGIVTITEFSDTVFSHQDEPVRAYPGVGMGLRAYLKDVAIPAVGVDAAYATRTGKWYFSAYIGRMF